jgi:hypothetical protein
MQLAMKKKGGVRDVRIVAINVQQLLMNGVVAYVQTTKYQNLVSLATIIVEDELELVAPFLPISKHQESITK